MEYLVSMHDTHLTWSILASMESEFQLSVAAARGKLEQNIVQMRARIARLRKIVQDTIHNDNDVQRADMDQDAADTLSTGISLKDNLSERRMMLRMSLELACTEQQKMKLETLLTTYCRQSMSTIHFVRMSSLNKLREQFRDFGFEASVALGSGKAPTKNIKVDGMEMNLQTFIMQGTAACIVEACGAKLSADAAGVALLEAQKFRTQGAKAKALPINDLGGSDATTVTLVGILCAIRSALGSILTGPWFYCDGNLAPSPLGSDQKSIKSGFFQAEPWTVEDMIFVFA